MSTRTLESGQILAKNGMADFICNKWDEYKGQRQAWEAEIKEVRDYLFATDTSTTSNQSLPWKNSTTLPKLCQIRDNLHANYLSALFPKDDWTKWEGHTRDDDSVAKQKAIQAYISNKVRESDFRNTASQLLLDYIDTGLAIADVVWCNESKEDPENGEIIPGYIGPKMMRVDPRSVVFDPTAESFEKSWKITRTVKMFGELKLQYKDTQDDYIAKAIDWAEARRTNLNAWSKDDHKLASGFNVDGFGDYYSYLGSGYIELLEFEGTLHDPTTGELYDDYIITVIDRNTILRKEKRPAWKRDGYKAMCGWRKRPSNIYPMGPLQNLVGMQYRIDHLQNAMADARDLTIMPPLVVKGEMMETEEWRPFARFFMEPDGDIRPLFTGTNIPAMEAELMFLLNMMEEMAGAPKQAMGIRTAGEKTAFEVQELANAAGRIFQEKVNQFEIDIIEKCLNSMLETAVRYMNKADIVRVMDDDLGVASFMTITKEDITAKGHIRPIGARHFAQQAQIMQNLSQVAASPVWAKIEPHVGDKKLAKLVEELLQLERFDLYGDNAGVMDKVDTQRLAQEGQETLMAEGMTPLGEE